MGESGEVGELIAVLSGKGGTGKTSVCAGVATALAASGRRVMCIDCDVGLRNLDISLGLSDAASLSFLEICRGDYPLTQATVHPQYPSLSFLTAPMNCAIDAIDADAFGRMVYEARKVYDYIFLDTPAGVDAGFRLTAAFADRCILVTGASPAAVRNAERAGQLLELMGKTNVRLVVNRVDRKMVSAMALTIAVSEAIRMVNLENGPDSFTLELTGLKIGPVAYVGIPGEPFTEIGVRIKEAEGFKQVMPVCLTNGCNGYFPSKEAFAAGGYESRSSIFGPKVSDQIVDGCKELLNELK